MALLTETTKEVTPAQLMPAETPHADPHGETLLHHAAGRHRQRPSAGEPTWAVVLAGEAPAACICCDIHLPLLLPGSRQASLRSLERYARPGLEAVTRHRPNQAGTPPTTTQQHRISQAGRCVRVSHPQ
jgi:hypothetical protein